MSSNILNLLSEDTFAEKMDIQNKLLAAIASDSGGVTVKSWADVQAIVRAGLADKIFSIGDQFVCEKNGVAIVWDIIGIDHDTPSDPRFSHSLTLQTHDVQFKHAFCDPNNISNEWANESDTLSLRYWLNSAAENDFLNGLDSDFLAVVGAVEKITAVNDTDNGGVKASTSSDKFFVLSRTEMFGTAVLGVDEGRKYAYYKTTDFAKKQFVGYSGAKYYFTRTKTVSGTSFATDKITGLSATAALSQLVAGTAYGVAPACCIY